MMNLNAFITEILTVDFRLFLPQMEMVTAVEETYTPTGEHSWRIKTDWSTATFGLFESTDVGKEYGNYYTATFPLELSVSCLQSALTDLLTMPNEQLKNQTQRLSSLVDVLGNKGYTGIQSDYSRIHDAFDLIPGLCLDEFNDWLKDEGIITVNLPPCSNRIRLRQLFYYAFERYIDRKIKALYELIDAGPVSLTPTSNEPKVNRPAITPGFDSYIVEKHRTKLMPYLVEYYTGRKVREIVPMLYALSKLTYLLPSTLNSNQTALHQAMEGTFGSIGTRQALNAAILRLDPEKRNEEEKRNIDEHTQRISQFLTPPPSK